ncbi:MAG: DHH family phosphoesterase [Eubacteriales bacterium]|nr:DHH family phosphoesterase [Eubacteriales bacterium]
MNTKIRFFTKDFVYLICSLAIAVALAFLQSARLGVIIVIFSLSLAMLYIASGILQKIKWQKIALKTLNEEEALSAYLNTMAIPTALTTLSGNVKWCNVAFVHIAGYGAMRNINKMIPGISIPDKEKKILIDGKAYKKEIFPVKYKHKEMLMYRLVDIENTVEVKKLYQNYLPVVCFIQIDNYDELAAEILQTELSEIVAAVERRIAAMAKNLSAVFVKTDRGRYLCVFERRFLSTMRASKFRILDDVREIKTTQSPTLSIAIGVGENPEQSGDYANKALELALGRGGDQAVIKQGDKFMFFGGTSKTVYRRSKVKSRMISHALKNLMEQCGEVYVMGHEVPDLDCIGASLGICACARYVGKKAYIVVDNPNPSIGPLLEKLASTDAYTGSIITAQEAGLKIDNSSMLVVVDTQIAGFTVSPNLLELADTVVVIDHHLRGATNIEKAALYYHEPFASSASELVTEILQYFGEDLRPLPIDIEALLIGITIDTKGFSFHTGVRTFEAASYLRRLGADTAVIRQLMQDDLETYSAKTDIVKNAEILEDGIAVAKCPKGVANAALIAAQAADALLTIRGITASFVVSLVDDNVVISGRSLGDVNVQLILESLGGGGHATIAAVRLNETDLDSAYKKLKKTIKKYLREGL